jgi:hypothetical protein
MHRPVPRLSSAPGSFVWNSPDARLGGDSKSKPALGLVWLRDPTGERLLERLILLEESWKHVACFSGGDVSSVRGGVKIIGTRLTLIGLRVWVSKRNTSLVTMGLELFYFLLKL